MAHLAHLSISARNAWLTFRLIDTNGGEAVDIEGFVTDLLTMNSLARNLDVGFLASDLIQSMSAAAVFMKFVEDELGNEYAKTQQI